MPDISVMLIEEFENPVEAQRGWTTAFDVFGPRVSGTVWLIPVLTDADEAVPSGVRLQFGPLAAGASDDFPGLMVNGVRLCGSFHIPRLGETDLSGWRVERILDGRREKAPAGVQRTVRQIIPLVSDAYLSDSTRVNRHRIALGGRLAGERAEQLARQIASLEGERDRIVERLAGLYERHAQLSALQATYDVEQQLSERIGA